MTTHLSAENLEQYSRRTLAARDLLAVDDHLTACESCRELAAKTPAGAGPLAALRADLRVAAQFDVEHLEAEQMTAYVDQDLDAADLGIVESHLAICSMCLDEVNDLRAFSASSQYKGAPTSTATVSSGFLDRLRDFHFWPADWSLPRFAVTAAGLLLFASATLVLVYVWRSTRSPRPEVATTQPPNAPTPQPSTENSSLPGPSVIPDPSAIVVSLDDGGQRVTLDEQGNLEGLGSLSPSTQRALKDALTDGRVQTPATLDALIGKSGVLMGDSSAGVAFPLVGPVGTIVRTNRPALRWRPLAGAQSYTVTLLDSRLNLVETSPPLTTTIWTVPRQLKRGQIYVWQVTALKDDKEVTSPVAPAPEARFKILEQVKVAELRRVEAGHPTSHLARGISYAEAGLLDDARREFRSLLAANPQSEVARKLLRNVEARRRAK